MQYAATKGKGGGGGGNSIMSQRVGFGYQLIAEVDECTAGTRVLLSRHDVGEFQVTRKWNTSLWNGLLREIETGAGCV